MPNAATMPRSIPFDCHTPEGGFKQAKGTNSVSTTKYTLLSFIPKSLFEQFRRLANTYFALVAGLSCLSYSPFEPYTTITPLVLVLAVSILKEAVEDWHRYQSDKEENNRDVLVFDRVTGEFALQKWKSIVVGAIVQVRADEAIPADLVCLATAHQPDGVAYVETINLDGETNLKVKQAMAGSKAWTPDSLPGARPSGSVECEPPNASLYTFKGNLTLPAGEGGEPAVASIPAASVLLRGSSLRNTAWVLGGVVYTGSDSKIQMNASGAPSKRSTIERQMDRIVGFMFASLFAMCFIGSVVAFVWARDRTAAHWYLAPGRGVDAEQYDPDSPITVALISFVTSFILYSYFIPISMYISVEMVKVVQAYVFINQDVAMYHAPSRTRAAARTSNLNEELGMVHTILTDKTGTLTCNEMEFFKASIAGVAYGTGQTEIERAAKARHGVAPGPSPPPDPAAEQHRVKGFNFYDARLMDGAWRQESTADSVAAFFRLLALCHTAVPSGEGDSLNYEAESPDEAALVMAGKQMGFACLSRNSTSITLREATPQGPETRVFELLHVLAFDSTRKRMSVVVRDPEGGVRLLCKGADNVIYERLKAGADTDLKRVTRGQLEDYSQAGLRTLCLASRELSAEEYAAWAADYHAADTCADLDARDGRVAEVAAAVERDLTLLGCTAIEDRLQDGVPACIRQLWAAGIRIWMLTGDKVETAINIAHACSLMDEATMSMTVIKSDNPAVVALEDKGEYDRADKLLQASVERELMDTQRAMRGDPKQKALVIDGRALGCVLSGANLEAFIEVTGQCTSVVCCRVSPKQKAQVTRMVRKQGAVTLGIGDGANDVGMIQAAHIGVGISGQEGMQAVMSSDFSIAQFRFLETLLLVHGHWDYRRLARMVSFFFYKNVFFGLTIFIFNSYTLFSGQFAYNDLYMGMYNVLFTSLAPLVVGVFDQDASRETLHAHPALYQAGVANRYFNLPSISLWFSTALLHSLTTWGSMVALFCAKSGAQDASGRVASIWQLGATMFTTVVVAVHLQLASTQSFWTWVHHLCYWGSVAVWFLYLLVHGALPLDWAGNVYQLLVGIVGRQDHFWLSWILVSLLCVVPAYLVYVTQQVYLPTDGNIAQQAEVVRERKEAREARGEVEMTPVPVPPHKHKPEVTSLVEEQLSVPLQV